MVDSKENLKSKVFLSLCWKFFERGGVQIIQFVVSLVVARLLNPSDYGSVALLTIFTTIATVFVQSGLSNTLIQKKDANQTDFSSVFYYSLILAFILYWLLFFCAPFISNFYQMPELTDILRIMALTLFPGAFNSVQNAVVAKHLQFRKQFFSSMTAVVLSGILGVFLAVLKYGAWALVFQQLSYQCIICIVMWFTVKWRPTLQFSFTKTKNLLKYGTKLLGAKLINTIYTNLESLIIGKKYSSEMLAFYGKGKQFPLILIDNIDGSVQSVMFPAYATKQEDLLGVKNMLRRTLSLSTYLVFPAMMGLAATGKFVVYYTLGDQWMSSVPFLQLFCFISALYPLQTANLQAINAIGKSSTYLKLTIIKRTIGVLILIMSVCFFKNIFAIVLACMITEVLAVIINIFPNKKILNYAVLEQFHDVFPNFILSIAMAVPTYMLSFLNIIPILILLFQAIVGVVLYLLLSWVTRNNSFMYIINAVMPKVRINIFAHKKNGE